MDDDKSLMSLRDGTASEVIEEKFLETKVGDAQET